MFFVILSCCVSLITLISFACTNSKSPLRTYVQVVSSPNAAISLHFSPQCEYNERCNSYRGSLEWLSHSKELRKTLQLSFEFCSDKLR